MKKALRMGDLLEPDSLRAHLEGVLAWKNLTLTGVYRAEPVALEAMLGWLETYGEP